MRGSAGQPTQVLAEIVRSGIVEGTHRGTAVALAADGSVEYAAGEVGRVMLPRSCNKPLQAAVMVDLGLDLAPELLALAGASHSAEPFHIEGVRRILRGAGMDESALQNPPDLSLEPAVREASLRAGDEATRLAMNCSGKHAAMLATCVVRGWDVGTYLSPEHPLQVAIREGFAELTGERPEVAVDGCGAPLLSTSLVGLARAFSALATATTGGAARVAAAMRAHPEYVSGSRRDECALHRAVPGLVGKLGAEACYAVALPDGRAWALKVGDGSDRARPIVMARLLELAGVLDEPGVDAEAVRRTGAHPLLGGGVQVGAIRAAF